MTASQASHFSLHQRSGDFDFFLLHRPKQLCSRALIHLSLGVKNTIPCSFDSLSIHDLSQGRSFDAFLKESKAHGWPSFRDEEVRPHTYVLCGSI